MSSLKETLKLYFWYLRKKRFLVKRKKSAIKHLRYAYFIQKTDYRKRYFCERDMVFGNLPYLNPKTKSRKNCNFVSSSNDHERKTLEMIPKELEKLERWKRRYVKFEFDLSKKSKVRFNNEKMELKLKQV